MSDKCTCICHTRSGIKHNIACCAVCPSCRDRISVLAIDKHFEACKAKLAAVMTPPPQPSRPISDKAPPVRLLLFKNGDKEGRTGLEVLVQLTTLPDLYDFCTEKLQMNFPCRKLFDFDGKEIKEISKVDSGTVFCSGGEPFKRPATAVLQKHDQYVERRQSVVERRQSVVVQRRMSRMGSISGGSPAGSPAAGTPKSTFGSADREVSEGELNEMKSMFLALLKEDRGFRNDVRAALLQAQR